MKHLTAFVLLLLVAASGAAHAQEVQKPRAEIGFRGGLTVFREGGTGVSMLSFPGDNLFNVSTVYVTMSAAPTLALEPQVGFLRIGTESGSSGAFTGAFQVNQFFSDPSAGSAFGLINLGFTSGFGDSGSSTVFAAGGGAGYRTIWRETLGVRLEGRYRRWFGENAFGTNEFSLLVGLGAVLGRSSR